MCHTQTKQCLNRQADGQKSKRAHGLTNEEADRQTNRLADRRTDIHTDRKAGRQTGGQTDSSSLMLDLHRGSMMVADSFSSIDHHLQGPFA